MPFGLGIWEIVILGVVLMLLFGAKGLPDAAKRMGKGVREIQGAMDDLDPRKALLSPSKEKEPSQVSKPAAPAGTIPTATVAKPVAQPPSTDDDA